MQQDPSLTNTNDAQDYESSALPYVPHMETMSYSSNVQENPSSNPEGASTAQLDENAGHKLDASPTLAPAVAVVSLPESAFSRRLRPRWMYFSLLLLLMAIVAYASFALATYINRSTPQKTLDTFCSSLKKQDYVTAYEQFSPDMQLNFTESQFAQLLATDVVVDCQHGAVDEGGASTTTSLRLVHHASGGVNQDKVILTKDSRGQWKINALRTA